MSSMEMHIYYCGRCNLHFAVDAQCEEQEYVICNICHEEDEIENAGYGITTVTVEPDHESA